MLGLCDDALAEKAGINISDPESLPNYLKVRKPSCIIDNEASR